MLIQLAILGLIAALLPLSVVWASKDVNKFRKLAWVTLFLTFDLIMFGAFTRLTDSGLGCPDWPGCYGHANPVQAHAQISAAEAAMPHGPVTVTKAWIEMIHRYLAMAVGVLIVGMMVVAWMRWRKSGGRDRVYAPLVPTLLFGFVCLQGAFGAWTVTMKLQPVIVTTHLLLGMALLGMLTWMAARQSLHAPIAAAGARLRVPAAIGLLVLVMQIALGGWVSTNYAALACTDFPLCHGAVVPPMDYEHGFTLWRELGKTAGGDYLPFDALTAIHWTHRTFAFVVLAYLGWLGHKAMRIDGLQKTGRGLLLMIVVQFLIGMATVFLKWPLAIAVMHNGGAALLVGLMVMLNYKANLSAGTRPLRAASSAYTA
jgi:cytochrome c oxidase assembly protein subunit 15